MTKREYHKLSFEDALLDLETKYSEASHEDKISAYELRKMALQEEQEGDDDGDEE